MTDKELSGLLSDLKESAEKLNAESNSVNSIIFSIENQIVQANTGVEFWLGDKEVYQAGDHLSVTDEDGKSERGCLGFAKVDGVWGLFIKSLDDYGTIPLHQASREIRIASLALLPKLVKGLDDEVKRKLRAIEQARLLVEEPKPVR